MAIAVLIISCGENHSSYADSIPLTVPKTAQQKEIPVEQVVHAFLKQENLEDGEGNFHLQICGANPIGTGWLICFTDSNDYFGETFAGLLLTDSAGRKLDYDLLAPDSFGVKILNTAQLRANITGNSAFLRYKIIFPLPKAQKYLDSIEEKYWKDHPELARPNENRFGLADLPAKYLDSLVINRSEIVKDGKLQRK